MTPEQLEQGRKISMNIAGLQIELGKWQNGEPRAPLKTKDDPLGLANGSFTLIPGFEQVSGSCFAAIRLMVLDDLTCQLRVAQQTLVDL